MKLNAPEIEDTEADITKLLSQTAKSLADDWKKDLTVDDINYLLYSCENEERTFNGGDCYDLPNYWKLKYAGFAGVKSLLLSIGLQNNLGHPLCENLRQGNW